MNSNLIRLTSESKTNWPPFNIYLITCVIIECATKVRSFIVQLIERSFVDTIWWYIQKMFKLTSADISWKYHQMRSTADIGLRHTYAYHHTSACAICVRKCVREGFGHVCAMCVCAARFWAYNLRSHFCTLFSTKWQYFLFKNVYFCCFRMSLSVLERPFLA